MIRRFAPTHAITLGLVLCVTGYITWSAVSASSTLNNLVVVAPVAVLLVVLCLIIVATALLRPEPDPQEAHYSAWGDLALLAGFAVFCFGLTTVGFDVATFLFVWAGVVVSGGQGKWQPPLYAALFTVLMVEGFGALFPYPMTTLVL
ncbi:hypothetical protein DSD19_07105 [Rhodovulum sp. BSW8]|uniref:Tripartite tricarboxylate transporter TctB family protein n=3 Tax=Rhodovulum TaxID=34008 RepID=A0ABS1RDT4_9RHOB|nr:MULTISPECIES: tripartite tricarboxylate transporter TctB family protein [Rhodovulum]OLS42359.1 hypothetical protein BV509_20790 [Rhodovulum sulfidophilum]MBL3569996.1 tripartite tricarboxylate transporter TctB family protein [Rhodovulum visakhapatnamense]MBL3577807.1 tripartite tricarboxylate transporter TctB family protein [Rhodovulum visakhapatnamense]PTW46589.1 tripartite tricarboxylate transporter TctB family protein [Rhodovulum kholense]RAP41107.1 hypothetical protein BYZ73_11800 [Rhod